MVTLGVLCAALSVAMLAHSLSGAGLVGCGAGSACDSVTGSRWGYIFGGVPVSLPALASYIVLLISVFFLDGRPEEPKSLDGLLWPLLLLLGGTFAGCAVWFCSLQAGVLHSFCKYCTLLHILDCTAAVIVLCRASCRRKWLFFAAGLVCAALFALLQVRTAPEYVYDEGRASSSLPLFSSSEMYAVGPEDAGREVMLLYDFQCSHCRNMHPAIAQACAEAGVRAVLCPVPLSNSCNPYIPDGIDRFEGSCALTRLALAVWYARPSEYPGFENWMMAGEKCPPVDEVRARAGAILSAEGLERALADTRIEEYLRRAYELFGRTSASDKGAVPRFVNADHWIVPETDSAEALALLLGNL